MITFLNPELFKEGSLIRVTFFIQRNRDQHNRDKAIEKINIITNGETIVKEIIAKHDYKKTISKNNREIEFRIAFASESNRGLRTHFAFIEQGILLNPDYSEIYNYVVRPSILISHLSLEDGVDPNEIVNMFLC